MATAHGKGRPVRRQGPEGAVFPREACCPPGCPIAEPGAACAAGVAPGGDGSVTGTATLGAARRARCTGCLTVPTPPSRPLRVSSDGLPVPACPPRCLLQDATCSGRNVCVLPSVCVAIPPRSVVALAGRVSGGRLGHEGRVPTCKSQGLACSPLPFAT